MAALLVANTLLWPMARFLNDKFVPEEHRVTANHIMTVGHHFACCKCHSCVAGKHRITQCTTRAVQCK